MNLILYATTGGTTARVAALMREALGHAAAFDVKALDAGALPASLDLVIAGTPTYGIGDWHYAWSARIDDVLPVLASARQVALFGLGDARFHGGSFCGGLGRLHDAVTGAGIRVRGHTAADRYVYSFSPSLRDGVFPGLALDVRQSRHTAASEIAAWVARLSSQPATLQAASIHPAPGR